MWNDYAQNPSAALKWQQLYCQFMFQLEDASADGTIDSEEFTTVCSAYGIDPEECKVAFKKMAKVRYVLYRSKCEIVKEIVYSSSF